MKPKNFSKKLKLNKKTIAFLNSGEMRVVYGGEPPPTWIWATCPPNMTCDTRLPLHNCCVWD